MSDITDATRKETAQRIQTIKAHLALYPLMQARDIYKLLYQSVCGAEHLMTSAREFEANLQAEFDSVTAQDEEPLMVPLRTDGTLSRINLRPYKARGGTVAMLLRECMLAMQPVDTSLQDALSRGWEAFVNDCRAGYWSTMALSDVLELDTWLIQQDYPAVHHSDEYRHAYKPAYRLVVPNAFV